MEVYNTFSEQFNHENSKLPRYLVFMLFSTSTIKLSMHHLLLKIICSNAFQIPCWEQVGSIIFGNTAFIVGSYLSSKFVAISFFLGIC